MPLPPLSSRPACLHATQSVPIDVIVNGAILLSEFSCSTPAMAYLTPKLLLFVLHAVLGSVGFYVTLFYRQYLELSLTQIGIAIAISAFGNLLAGPVWTIVIERCPNRHGQLLAALMLTGTMAIVALRLSVDLIEKQLWFLASCISSACYGVFALPCCALADYAVLKILGCNSILYGKHRCLHNL